jgi:RNA polymerase subunit RPABC4/transcription elongation factor Spt4
MTKYLSVLFIILFVFSAFAWICPECGGENADTTILCSSCGKVEVPSKNCPNCGTRIATTSKFCPECGFNFETNTLTTIGERGTSKQTMGEVLLLTRFGVVPVLGMEDNGSFGVQFGFNLGSDVFLSLDTTFGGSPDASILNEFFIGFQGFAGKEVVRFSWGSYLGFISMTIDYAFGDDVSVTAFSNRDRLGISFQFSRTFGLELALSVDMAFGAESIVFILNPTIGIVLAL